MVDITFRPESRIPPAEVADVELYHPKSWWTKYVFCRTPRSSPSSIR